MQVTYAILAIEAWCHGGSSTLGTVPKQRQARSPRAHRDPGGAEVTSWRTRNMMSTSVSFLRGVGKLVNGRTVYTRGFYITGVGGDQ